MEIFRGRRDLFFAATHSLGYILGEKIYYALMENLIHKSDIRHLFYDPWKGYGKPFQTYWTWLVKTQAAKLPRRM